MPPFPSNAKTCRGKADPVEYPYPSQVYPRERGRARSQESPETPTARSSQVSVCSNQYTF